MKGATCRRSDQFNLRLPDGMRDLLWDIAVSNRRSMNSEIVTMLEKQIHDSLQMKKADTTD